MVSGKPRHRLFWALRDISFEVKKGQVVGLLGRNGAGKSTLLKLICGKLDATAGEVKVQGRISSILELGTGFSPDYTGRENVRLGGLMIGMTEAEIDQRLEWIIDFSELREFIDQPFRTYSSGMQTRLTFATAVCVDPDILIVDEALAVGDAKFQRKCFSKMMEFREAGRTILLVSHDTNTISTFCDHAILLEHGRILEQGEPRHVSMVYFRLIFADAPALETSGPGDAPPPPPTASDPNARPGHLDPETVLNMAGEAMTRRKAGILQTPSSAHEMRTGSLTEAEILEFGIVDSLGQITTTPTSGERYRFFVIALFHTRVDRPAFGFNIRSKKGVDMFGVDTRSANIVLRPHEAGEVLVGYLDVGMWLTNGDYFLSATIGATPDGREAYPIDFRYDALLFSIGRLPEIQHASVVNLQHKFGWTDYALNEPGARPTAPEAVP